MSDVRQLTNVMRTASTKFNTRDEDGKLSIEGYFAVFDSVYQIAPDMSESIAVGAFDNTLSGVTPNKNNLSFI